MYNNFFIYSSVNGHLGCFHVLTIANSAVVNSQLLVLFLLTVQSFSIFDCKEYNQSDFGVDRLVMSMCRVSLVLLKEGVCYDQCVLLAKLY